METSEEKLIKEMIFAKKADENRKFGEFIIQSNEIQFYLSKVILLNSSYPDKKYKEFLERAELGTLIHVFCSCADNKQLESMIIPKLRKYKNERNKLAHKMYSSEKLTKKECEDAINDGKIILKCLNLFLKHKLLEPKK